MAETLAEFVDLCAFLAIETLDALRELGQRAAELLGGSRTGADFAHRPAQFDQFVVRLRVVDGVQARGERVHRPCQRVGLMGVLGEEGSFAVMIADNERSGAGGEGRERERRRERDPGSAEAVQPLRARLLGTLRSQHRGSDRGKSQKRLRCLRLRRVIRSRVVRRGIAVVSDV